ncbi:GFA family protein [Pseudomonas lalucatii]|nr:GFA family protein [Pseudomonas lalucatii]
MKQNLKGQCLCGNVKFELSDDFKAFYQCHCAQCQRLTGSAFASNIFTRPDNIEWTSGKADVSHYEHPTREFSKAFCRVCGSAVPFVNKSRTSLIVPAGSLLDKPSISPQANIFAAEEAHWLADGLKAHSFEGFPE